MKILRVVTTAGWWDDLSPEARKAYIKNHPNSKYAGGGKGSTPAPPSRHAQLTKKGAETKRQQSEKKALKAPTAKHPKIKLTKGGFDGIQQLMKGAKKVSGVDKGHDYVHTKSGVGISIHVDGGNRFDHSVPIKDRGPDKKAPKYYALNVDVFVEGETHRQTVDGPIGNTKTPFSWTKKFAKEPTKEELDAAQAELHEAIREAQSKYKDLIKHYNK